MPKFELKRFTKIGVLMRIELWHLIMFFDRFKEELKAGNCWPPVEPGSEAYYSYWANTLACPDKLPEALIEAVLAIEEQVTETNWPRLEQTILHLRMYNLLGIDNSVSRETQALQVWLWCPYVAGANLAELQPKIEPAKKVYDEKVKIDWERQKQRDRELQKPEDKAQNGPLTPALSRERGEEDGKKGDG